MRAFAPRLRFSYSYFRFLLEELLHFSCFYAILFIIMWNSVRCDKDGGRERTNPMLAIERKNEILQKLRAEQRVLVSELAAHYQVTEKPPPRPRQARKRGLRHQNLRRRHPRQQYENRPVPRHPQQDERRIQKPDCRPRLPDGRRWGPSDDRRQLDGAVLRKETARQENLTIITNSVELVVELANVETWSILLTGGRLKAESLALVGSQCEKYLGNYHVDKVFVSCKGLDREAGVTDSERTQRTGKAGNAPRWAAEDSRRRQLEDRPKSRS